MPRAKIYRDDKERAAAWHARRDGIVQRAENLHAAVGEAKDREPLAAQLHGESIEETLENLTRHFAGISEATTPS